jgi:hypothetical protein
MSIHPTNIASLYSMRNAQTRTSGAVEISGRLHVDPWNGTRAPVGQRRCSFSIRKLILSPLLPSTYRIPLLFSPSLSSARHGRRRRSHSVGGGTLASWCCSTSPAAEELLSACRRSLTVGARMRPSRTSTQHQWRGALPPCPLPPRARAKVWRAPSSRPAPASAPPQPGWARRSVDLCHQGASSAGVDRGADGQLLR